MNRIAALVISTILLTQIASYSYGDIPSQIEWEEPLKGDPDWKVTGRNSTNNNESVWGESIEMFDITTYPHNNGEYSEIVWEAYNLANDTAYIVSYDLWKYDNSTNVLSLLDSEANMTIFNSSSYHFVYNTTNSTADGFWTTTNTPSGCYYVQINLRALNLNSSYGFDWAVNTTCGNNSAGNNSVVGSQTNPIMPTNCSRIDWNLTVNVTIDDCINGTSTFWFELQSNFSMVWIDPEVAVGYDYIVYGGPKISGVNIPVGYGDDIFDLFMFDSVTGWYDTGTNIDAGTTHVFNPPTDNMSIRGIETSELLDPTDPTAFVSGLTFETNGTVVMTMTPVTETVTCGQDSILTELHIVTDSDGVESSTFSEDDHIMGTFSVSCGIDQEEYQIQSALVGDSGTISDDGWSWVESVGMPNDESVDYMMLASGDYCINATLTDSNNNIITNYSCFTVVGDQDNTVGNPSYEGGLDYYCYGLNDSIMFHLDISVPGETSIQLQWQVTNDSGWGTVASDNVDLPLDDSGGYSASMWITPTFEPSNFFETGVYTLTVTPVYTSNLTVIFDDSPYYYDFAVNCNGSVGNSSGQIEWSDYSVALDEDCIEGIFYINGTLFDTNNISGGTTELIISIYHVDDNEVETLTGLSDSLTLSFTSGSVDVSYMVDPTGYASGQYYVHLHTNSNGNNLDRNYWFTLGCDGICGHDPSIIGSNYRIFSNTFGTLFSNGNQTSNWSNSVNDDTPQIYQGDTLSVSMWFSCLVFEEDYLANLTVTNDANSIVFSEEESFTQSSWSNWYNFYENGISTDQLPAGEYCLTFTLYVSPFGSSDVIYTVTECVEIVPLDDWDGCGTNLTYLQHLQDVNGNPFVQQGTVFLTTSEIWYNNFVDCLVIGENYTMVTTVTDDDGTQHMQETYNFTINQFSDMTQWSWGTIFYGWIVEIPNGNYCVETTIHSTDSTYTNMIALVSTVTNCFAVVEITPTDWWGDQTNNSTGSPNNPIMPDTNCTNLSSSLSGLNLTNAFNLSDCENGTGFWFNLTVNGTGVNWYDPVYAVGYDFEVLSGPNFASVVVPPGYGDDKYDIYLWDGSEYVLAASDLDALTQYWFTDDGQITTTPGDYDGITMFSIRGLELDAKLDPDDPNAFVTGLTFVQDPNEVSEVVLSMNPIRVSDEDDDGIADAEDNCVDDANADQADADGDGIGDVCDTAASGGGKGDGGTVEPDSESDSDSNRTLAYAALLAVALVGILVMFGREDER